MSAQQIDKLLAEHWHQLSEAERAPWEGRAADDKARHKKTKGAVPAPVVKRPKNAYMHFAGSLRAELMAAGHKVTEVSILTGKKWAVLGQEERAQWEAKAAEDKERYRAELEASGAAGAGATPQAAGRQSRGARAKRTGSAYNWYVKEQMPVLLREMGLGARAPDAMRAIGAAWRELNEERKAVYRARALEAAEAAAAARSRGR